MEKMDFKIKEDCELSLNDIINGYGFCGSPDCCVLWEDWLVRKFGQFGLHNPIPHNAIKNALAKLPNAPANAAIQWMKDCDLLEEEEWHFLYVQAHNHTLDEMLIYAVFEGKWEKRLRVRLGTINKKTGGIELDNLAARKGKELEMVKKAGLSIITPAFIGMKEREAHLSVVIKP